MLIGKNAPSPSMTFHSVSTYPAHLCNFMRWRVRWAYKVYGLKNPGKLHLQFDRPWLTLVHFSLILFWKAILIRSGSVLLAANEGNFKLNEVRQINLEGFMADVNDYFR